MILFIHTYQPVADSAGNVETGLGISGMLNTVSVLGQRVILPGVHDGSCQSPKWGHGGSQGGGEGRCRGRCLWHESSGVNDSNKLESTGQCEGVTQPRVNHNTNVVILLFKFFGFQISTFNFKISNSTFNCQNPKFPIFKIQTCLSWVNYAWCMV